MSRLFSVFFTITTVSFMVPVIGIVFYLKLNDNPGNGAVLGFVLPFIVLMLVIGSIIIGAVTTFLYEGFRPVKEEEWVIEDQNKKGNE